MSIGLARLREEPDRIRQGAIDKGEDPSIVDAALALEGRRRELLVESDRLKAERNTASKQIGEAIRAGAAPTGPEVAALRQASTDAGTQIEKLDAELAAAETGLAEALALVGRQRERSGILGIRQSLLGSRLARHDDCRALAGRERKRELAGGADQARSRAEAALRAARLRVDQLDALRSEIGERRVDVVHLVGDVVHARPALREEAPDRRVLAQRRHQLDAAVADTQQGRLDALLHDGGPVLEPAAEETLVRLHRLVQVRNGQADVVDPSCLHAVDAM